MAKDIFNADLTLAMVKDFSRPFRTFECVVPQDWTDFNGHMNEARYLDCFSNASDVLMQLIGCDEAYIAGGKSFFTVETHIRHLDEVEAGKTVFVTTQILKTEGKKLHLFHLLYREYAVGSPILASGEQLLLHVDLGSRRTSEPDHAVADNMRKYGDAHAHLPMPEGVGRVVGQKR